MRTRHFVFALSSRLPSAPGAEPRLGITASRRVGNAVARNRIKRVVREAFRATRDIWPPGCDVVVIVRWAEPGLRLDAVVAEWRAAATQIAKRATDAQQDAQRDDNQAEVGSDSPPPQGGPRP